MMWPLHSLCWLGAALAVAPARQPLAQALLLAREGSLHTAGSGSHTGGSGSHTGGSFSGHDASLSSHHDAGYTALTSGIASLSSASYSTPSSGRLSASSSGYAASSSGSHSSGGGSGGYGGGSTGNLYYYYYPVQEQQQQQQQQQSHSRPARRQQPPAVSGGGELLLLLSAVLLPVLVLGGALLMLLAVGTLAGSGGRSEESLAGWRARFERLLSEHVPGLEVEGERCMARLLCELGLHTEQHRLPGRQLVKSLLKSLAPAVVLETVTVLRKAASSAYDQRQCRQLFKCLDTTPPA